MSYRKPIKGVLCSSVLAVAIFLPTAAWADDIVVAAAMSLKKPFELIGKDFEKSKGLHINFDFGASGILAQQIVHGAPVDVFAPASCLELGILRAKGLIASGDTRLIANNRLVLVVAKTSPFTSGLTVLQNAKRIGIGNPSYTPSGRYAVQALKHVGSFDALNERKGLVYADNVKQALTYAENGSVDAAIVYATDAMTSSKTKVVHRFTTNDTETISYPIAIIRYSQHKKAAQAFVDWLGTPSSAEHLEEAGFTPIGSATK